MCVVALLLDVIFVVREREVVLLVNVLCFVAERGAGGDPQGGARPSIAARARAQTEPDRVGEPRQGQEHRGAHGADRGTGTTPH